ncbi:MAG: ribbon-helix-helix protein, CopG family [Candidatus Bathyarchaeia archaeon]
MEYHIVIRVELSLKELMKQVAKARGESISDFVRRAIKSELARLSYLSPEENKALGILAQKEAREDL